MTNIKGHIPADPIFAGDKTFKIIAALDPVVFPKEIRGLDGQMTPSRYR